MCCTNQLVCMSIQRRRLPATTIARNSLGTSISLSTSWFQWSRLTPPMTPCSLALREYRTKLHPFVFFHIRWISYSQRKCIFPAEINLEYFNDAYTFSGCMKECRIKKSIQFCQCIPPFYSPPGKKAKHCGTDDFLCLIRFKDNITDINSCKCELCCLNTVYDIEKFSKILISDSSRQEDFRVNIEYLTWPIIRYKREVLFGWVDLLVSFGGIAGLFLG